MARSLDGIGLAMIGAGSLFVYAGATNRSVLQGLQSVIRGQPPAAAAQNPFPATAGPPPGSPAPGGNAGGRGAGSGGTAWSTALLAAAGYPQTQANITSLNSWQTAEGGGGQDNPLNTTQVMPGSTNFNNLGGGQGVQNYVSVAQGIAATVKTLNNGHYGDIVMLLRSGAGLCGHTLQGLATWSGNGYSSVC